MWFGQILRKNFPLCTHEIIKIRFRGIKVMRHERSFRLRELSEGGFVEF